ncbi:hypothetical protein Tco_0666855 [Tanacetum coccineum]
MTPPLSFSTSPQIPNNTTSERSPMITTVFAATTPENTSFAYRTSTSTIPNPMISPAFVEANCEVLESLLRERRRQICNEDLRTELEYFSEDYDEEREMEPRPEPNREDTLTLRPRSPVVRRQRERIVGFEEAPNMEGSRRGRNAEGISPSEIEAENKGVNLPLLLAAHLGSNKSGQPLRSSLTSVQEGHQPSTNMGGGISLLMDKKLSRASLHRPLTTYRDDNRGQKDRDRFSPYRGPSHGLLSTPSKSSREILATEKAAGSFEQPPRMFRSRWPRDKTKCCQFHNDNGYVTNQCRELKHQVEEAVKSG